MKKHEDELEAFELKFHPRETELVSINVPKDTLNTLNRIAANRDMSLSALLKFYIGQGLRYDVAQHFGDHLLKTAEQILAKHIQSEEELSSIIREIRDTVVN